MRQISTSFSSLRPIHLTSLSAVAPSALSFFILSSSLKVQNNSLVFNRLHPLFHLRCFGKDSPSLRDHQFNSWWRSSVSQRPPLSATSGNASRISSSVVVESFPCQRRADQLSSRASHDRAAEVATVRNEMCNVKVHYAEKQLRLTNSMSCRPLPLD